MMSPATGKIHRLLKLKALDDVDYDDPDLFYHHDGHDKVMALYFSWPSK